MSERSGQFDPNKTPGAVGTAPPANAPREVAMPLSADAVAAALDKAQRNERALPPIVFETVREGVVVPAATANLGSPGGGKTAWQHAGVPPAPNAGAAQGSNTLPASRSAVQSHGRPSVTVAAKAVPLAVGQLVDQHGQPVSSETVAVSPVPSAPAAATAEQELAPPAAIRPGAPEGKLADIAREVLAQRARLAQPAASNSDSPARGVPRGTGDPGKQITGGFGDAVQAQYFPLDGNELRELVLSMMDRLAEQLQNDLRFSIAAVYPRVAVQLELKVEGFVEDIGFSIRRVLPPHEKTPIAVARELADEGVFVVQVTRAEMTADGESLSPPNAIREELGLAVPAKRAIDVPGGRMIVDVVNSLPGAGR